MTQPSSVVAPKREIAPLALAQLAAWRAYAARWCYRLDRRVTPADHRIPGAVQYHLACMVCDMSMMVLSSEGTPYMLNTEVLLDAITAHLRNVHRDQEVHAYGENTEASPDIGGAGNRGSGSPDPGGLQTKE